MKEFYQDPALIQAFIVESGELLQAMDQDLVALESAPENDELLNRIFRALHTIKGTAGFLGFAPMVQLGHRAEDVLVVLRRRELSLSQRIMNALFATRDNLGAMLNDLRSGAPKPKYEIEALLNELEMVQKTGAVGSEVQLSGSDPAQTLNAAVLNTTAPPIGNTPAGQTMRVDVHKLDDLINLVGELVLERNRLLQLAKPITSDRRVVDSPLSDCAARLSFVTEELQAAALRTRMVPIDTVFCRLPRLVRDLAQTLNKETSLVILGQDTEIDRTMVELMFDPLVHLVRNSLDHGLESPEERESAGKPRKGTICIEARQEGDRILVSISDDGTGIDPARVLGKAIDRRLVTAERAANLSGKFSISSSFPGLAQPRRQPTFPDAV